MWSYYVCTWKILHAHVKGITCARMKLLHAHVKGITCACEVITCNYMSMPIIHYLWSGLLAPEVGTVHREMSMYISGVFLTTTTTTTTTNNNNNKTKNNNNINNISPYMACASRICLQILFSSWPQLYIGWCMLSKKSSADKLVFYKQMRTKVLSSSESCGTIQMVHWSPY